jgi:hypothetical protein
MVVGHGPEQGMTDKRTWWRSQAWIVDCTCMSSCVFVCLCLCLFADICGNVFGGKKNSKTSQKIKKHTHR